jgi:hypothetical protein
VLLGDPYHRQYCFKSDTTTKYIQYPRTAAEEMTSVIVSMESNQIAVKYAEKDLVSNWKNAVDLATWERRVEEETNLDILLRIAKFLAKHGR